GNLICGNSLAAGLNPSVVGYGGGVVVFGASVANANNMILGNQIGISATGGPLGNSDAVAFGFGSSGNLGQGNTIAFNLRSGVAVGSLAEAAPAAARNRIQGNWIYGNIGLGIDLGSDGVTLNNSHLNDPSSLGKPNNWQSFPDLRNVHIDAAGNLVATFL